MSQPTSIEWCRDPRTGERGMTWNPIRGCSRDSEGCEHCFAERQAMRFRGPYLMGRRSAPFAGFADERGWIGRVGLIESKLEEPLHWRKPRLCFVNSMSDLFHPALSDADIDRVFAVMVLRARHIFILLTKRAQRMHDYLKRLAPFRFRNLWLGVSVENDKNLDRLDWLRKTPAARRFVSLEPMLGAVDIKPHLPALDWVIAGGETGPGARPMNPAWVLQIRDDCIAAGVPFFFKGWGEWAPTPDEHDGSIVKVACVGWDGAWASRKTRLPGTSDIMMRVGRKAAGRLLDGRSWDQMPEMK